MQHLDSREVRHTILEEWYKTLGDKTRILPSDTTSISGSTPPSIFVGSYNYPKVYAGPVLPPFHGDTSILDSPERWKGLSLNQIIGFRKSMIRGVKSMSVNITHGRYIENLQDVTMSSQACDSELNFTKFINTQMAITEPQSHPWGSTGIINTAKFPGVSTPVRMIERVFYDKDHKAQDAVMDLYQAGIETSKIHKCLSIGMLGINRKIVPTKWSITATDQIISASLLKQVIEYELIDSCRVFSYEHLGNLFVVILFPHMWTYEFTEAWHMPANIPITKNTTNSNRPTLAFGSDYEDIRKTVKSPITAGAYFAARLGVLEYLAAKHIQAGVVILREIRPEYAIPVGVWQVREGVREAMKQEPVVCNNLREAVIVAANKTNISEQQWISHGNMIQKTRQQTISNYF